MIIVTKYFSKEKGEEKKSNRLKEAAKGVALVGGAGGVGALAKYGGEKLTKQGAEKLMRSKLSAADEIRAALKEKLLEKAKKQGIKVIEDPQLNNAAYTGTDAGRGMRKLLAWGKKKARNDKNSLEVIEQAEAALKRKVGKEVYKNLGKDVIVMGNGRMSEADVLAHELGHAQYFKKGRSKNIVAKIAHKLHPISATATYNKYAKGGVFVHGLQSGIRNEKDKQEGKKSSTWKQLRSVAVPAAITAPMLIAEATASGKGIRMLKEAGASERFIKESRKAMGNAFKTYAGDSIKFVGLGAAGELAGRGIGKVAGVGKRKQKKQEQDKKEDRK